MKNALLFPGQGSQYVGMGADFFAQYASARSIFHKADALLGFSLSQLMFHGPEEDLKKTLHSQLAIFVMSTAILQVMREKIPNMEPFVCAGLSLGEYTALYASGRISFEAALDLIQERARLMGLACESHAGTMAVVLGLRGDEVDAVVHKLYPEESIWVANYNCPGQVVISGSIKGVEKASCLLKEKGAKRILPLSVQGAFHSGLMKDAEEAFRTKMQKTTFQESNIALVMNVPGDFVSSTSDLKNFLVEQISHSVRWEEGVRKMQEGGVDLFVEIGSGKTLSGMNKRIGTFAPTISVEKVEDLVEWEKMARS